MKRKIPTETPVYMFLGFLESGKTKFIQETMEDPRFSTDRKVNGCRGKNFAFSNGRRRAGL